MYRTGNYNAPGDYFNTFPFPAPASTTLNGDPHLSAFVGQKANGDWLLYVMDDASGDRGTIADGWNLAIKATS
jgi:subtilisin-like proprotein convertase family protein